MKKKIILCIALVALIMLFCANTAMAAGFDAATGTHLQDVQWPTRDGRGIYSTLTRWGVQPTDIKHLIITAGVLTDNDILEISEKLTNLETLEISGTASFQSDSLVSGAFSSATPGTRKLQSVIINPADANFVVLNNAFKNAASLTTANIPTASTFGYSAFEGCSSLTNVTLTNASAFGNNAFKGASSLVNISLPETQTFGTSAFDGAALLETVSLPKLQSAGDDMFSGCTKKIAMTLGAAVPSISTNIFASYAPESKTASIIVPAASEADYLAFDDGGVFGWYKWGINPPSLVSTTPADDAVNISLDTNLTAEFSKIMNKGTGSVYLHLSSDDSLLQTIDINSDDVEIVSSVVTINLTSTLPPSKDIYVLIQSGALLFNTNEPYEGIASKTTWNFTTESGYTVEHYRENLSGTYDLYEQDIFREAVGVTVNASANSYTDYSANTSHPQWVDTGVVAADGSLVLKLYYSIDTYNITYDAGTDAGNVPVDNTDYKVGGDVVVSSQVPTRDKYDFDGWLYGSAIYTGGDTIQMASGGLELIGQWSLKTVMVTYAYNDSTSGSEVVEETITHEYTLIDQPVRAGYVFYGWNTMSDGSGDEITADTEVVNETAHTLYAIWGPTEISVTPESDEINVGDTTSLSAAPIPSDAFMSAVTWTSSNPSVASVDANGVVTALMVGHAVITAKSDDLTDTCIVQVRSTDADDPSLSSVKADGEVYKANSSPVQSATVTMFSTPVSSTTNSDGYFYMGDIYEGLHTLVVEESIGDEIDRIPVSISLGSSESYVINSDGSVDIEYMESTRSIFIRVRVSDDLSDAEIVEVIFNRPAINPRTGDDMTFFKSLLYSISKFFKNLFN